jgi:hypothetical protein
VRGARMRDALTTALEVAGMAALSVGAGLAWLPAGLMTAGACMVAVGVFGARS